MEIFKEWRKRVDRADAHGEAFVKMCEVFIHDKPYAVTHEMRNDWEGVVKAVPVPEVVLHPDAQLVLGEFFYQLRAALDATMWEAHMHLGGTETSAYANRLDFPIFAIPEAGKKLNFKNSAFHDLLLPQTLKDWIRSIQPCFAGELGRTADDAAIAEALLIIHDCARKDRHRQLHIVGAYALSKTTKILARPAPAYISYQHIVPSDFFKDEFVIAEFGLASHTSNTEVYAKGSFALQISIKEVRPEPGADLAVQLWHLRNVVRLVAQRFAEAFE